MMPRNLLLLALGLLLALVVGFDVSKGIGLFTAEGAQPAIASSSAAAGSPGSSTIAQPPALDLSSAEASVENTPSSAQPGMEAVQDADLAQLAVAVQLGASANSAADARKWAQQLPVAQGLKQKMCDCEQRNWLNQFIATGKDAVAGSPGYAHDLDVLLDLPRNDDQLISGATPR
jgi:hypothetical protein